MTEVIVPGQQYDGYKRVLRISKSFTYGPVFNNAAIVLFNDFLTIMQPQDIVLTLPDPALCIGAYTLILFDSSNRRNLVVQSQRTQALHINTNRAKVNLGDLDQYTFQTPITGSALVLECSGSRWNITGSFLGVARVSQQLDVTTDTNRNPVILSGDTITIHLVSTSSSQVWICTQSASVRVNFTLGTMHCRVNAADQGQRTLTVLISGLTRGSIIECDRIVSDIYLRIFSASSVTIV
jgi:hypothetical protein